MKRCAHGSSGRFAPRKLALLVAAALASGGALATGAEGVPSPKATQSLLGLPISFERNDGQFRSEVIFAARGVAGEVDVRAGEIAIAPQPARRRNGARASPVAPPAQVLRLRLSGANPTPEIETLRPLSTRSNYYRGQDRATAIEHVPHFGELRMKDVYPGIDLALHGTEGRLEYDFVVGSGADPRDIRLDLSSAREARLDGAGNLILQSGEETLVQHAPIAYQQRGSERVPVASHFRLLDTPQGREAAFVLAEYDHTQPLVIDPILTYSTFLGGSGADFGGYMRMFGATSVFFANTTALTGDSLFSNSASVTVTRMNTVTNTVTFQTTLGGTSYDVAQALAIGASGGGIVSYVTGYTNSTDFPTSGAGCPARGALEDAFLAVLADDGTLARSCYIGGNGNESGNAIAVDASGYIYIAGDTDSSDFPTTTGMAFNNGTVSVDSDAFLMKLTPNFGTVVYSMYLGGSGFDIATGIAVDAGANVHVVGRTTSTDFPLVNAYDTNAPTGPSDFRAFAIKMAPDGSAAEYSTYLGASADNAVAVIMDPSTAGGTVILGETAGSLFSPTSARPYAGGQDVFVLRLGASGDALFGSLLGGSSTDYAGGVAANSQGDIYVTGTTYSPDFPINSPLAGQGTFHGGVADAFVARFRSGALDFSTFLGGSASEAAYSIALGGSGAVYVAGSTYSADFPTVNPMRGIVGNSDLFFSKLDFHLGKRFDFNGDGTSDLVWRDTSDASVFQWLMSGTSVLLQTSLGGSGTLREPTHIADFNGDGKADILWQSVDGSTSMTTMDGGTMTSDVVLVGPGTGWIVTQVADLNGDGKADLIWQHTDGTVQAWLMDGTTATSVASFVPAGSGWSDEGGRPQRRRQGRPHLAAHRRHRAGLAHGRAQRDPGGELRRRGHRLDRRAHGRPRRRRQARSLLEQHQRRVAGVAHERAHRHADRVLRPPGTG